MLGPKLTTLKNKKAKSGYVLRMRGSFYPWHVCRHIIMQHHQFQLSVKAHEPKAHLLLP